jgi:hypothetical protein
MHNKQGQENLEATIPSTNYDRPNTTAETENIEIFEYLVHVELN